MDDKPIRLQLSGSRWLYWALWALALAGLGYLAGLTLWLGISGLGFPYQLDYGEGIQLHFVSEWAKGHPIYRTLYSYPYITANYAPLTLLLALALTPLLGVTYAAGRIWTLLAILSLAITLVAWIRQSGGRWLVAAVTALLFVGSPYIYHWAPLFRMDILGLALTVAGIYAVWRSVESRRPHLLWLAAVLFVAALYAKQSFVFAPAAAIAYLFFFVDRRRALEVVAIMGLLGGGLFVLIDRFTGGGFWQSMVVSNVNPFLWPEFWQQLGAFARTFAVLGLLTAWYLVDKFVLDRSLPLQKKVNPLDLYLIAALASLVLAGKAGSWENYFFEALFVLALYSGLALNRLGQMGQPGLHLLVPVLVLIQISLMWYTPRAAERYMQLTRESNEAMAPILARTPDPIISEDTGLLVSNGKTVDYHSFEYSQLARAGRWDQAWVLDQLRQRRLSMVILETGTRLDVDHYQRFTREFMSELDLNYAHTGTVGKYELYEPDPLQHQRRAEFSDQLALVGWSLHAPPEVNPGDTISLTVVWQAQQSLQADYTAFAHLVDEQSQGWAGDDHAPYDGIYPTSSWGAGEMVRDSFTLTVPPDAPAGLYNIQVGWYEPTTQQRLPVGQGDTVRVAVLPVGPMAQGSQALTPVQIRFGEAITLQGYAWQTGSEGIDLTLQWSTDRDLDTDYTIFAHLVDPNDADRIVAQDDAPPMGGRWPTSLWLPGVAVADRHRVSLPVELPPGRYALQVGFYDVATGERLHLADGSDTVALGEIALP
jgi:hypothetical protein